MTIDLSDGRYDRQELITWWEQRRLRAAKVLVVGAGALGNEIVKNLALLGVGHLTIVDMDSIELSNLARCVLFRDADAGRPKAVVAAAAAHEINPDVVATPVVRNVMLLGLGVVDSFDVVIAGLDNREARCWLNQASRKLGKWWVDGAIEGLAGVARVFGPTGACYECTLGEMDYQLMADRKSCALLSADDIAQGRTPTTSTTASIVAAIQVQEAVKLLHDRSDLLRLEGRGFVYQGDAMDSYVIEYTEDCDCPAHDRYGDLVHVSVHERSSMADLVDVSPLSSPPVAEFEDEIVLSGKCLGCGQSKSIGMRLAALPKGSGLCDRCSEPLRLDVRQTAEPDDALWSVPLVDLGYDDRDVVTVRVGEERTHYLLSRA